MTIKEFWQAVTRTQEEIVIPAINKSTRQPHNGVSCYITSLVGPPVLSESTLRMAAQRSLEGTHVVSDDASIERHEKIQAKKRSDKLSGVSAKMTESF